MGIVGYIMGRWAIWTNRRKSPEEIQAEVWRSLFKLYFKFEIVCVKEEQYQRQALLRLAFLAKAVVEEAELLKNHDSDDSIFDGPIGSNNAIDNYRDALDCLDHFYPELAERVPPWSDLARHLQAWEAGATFDGIVSGKCPGPAVDPFEPLLVR